MRGPKSALTYLSDSKLPKKVILQLVEEAASASSIGVSSRALCLSAELCSNGLGRVRSQSDVNIQGFQW